MLRRTPIKRQSAKRKREYPIYRKLAAQFIRDHPYCQHFIAEHGLDERGVIFGGGYALFHGRFIQVPPSSEVHHVRGRGKYYLDVSTWMAVRAGHATYIHGNPSYSRQKGYILDR